MTYRTCYRMSLTWWVTTDIPYMLQNVADMVGDYGGDQMYAFRLKPGVDGDRFLEKASREWRKTLQFGNYRVQDVYSFEDRVDSGTLWSESRCWTSSLSGRPYGCS